MTTTVLNLSHPGVLSRVRSGEVIYIGRANKRLNLPESPLSNPYPINSTHNRSDVCRLCLENKLQPAINSRSGAVWAELNRLADILLETEKLEVACYCAPQQCHGNDVVRLVEEIAENRASRVSIQKPRAQPPPTLYHWVLTLNESAITYPLRLDSARSVPSAKPPGASQTFLEGLQVQAKMALEYSEGKSQINAARARNGALERDLRQLRAVLSIPMIVAGLAGQPKSGDRQPLIIRGRK